MPLFDVMRAALLTDKLGRSAYEVRGARSVSVDVARDPRYRQERSGGYGTTAPYLPPRLGLPVRRTGRPVGHVPTRPAPKLSVSS